MTQVKKISRDQALHAIESGEYADDVLATNRKVAVLMTQDWCSQWAAMRKWIYSLEDDFDLYELIYNQVDYFNEFRIFKETKWKNGLIPYVRYYSSGRLIAESNYVSKEEFLQNLGQ